MSVRPTINRSAALAGEPGSKCPNHRNGPHRKPITTMNQPLIFTRRAFVGMCSAALLCLSSIAFSAGPAPERDQARFEIDFLKTMIDHHFGAIKMSELCKGRTVHAELQAMCDSIIAMQSAEIEEMRGWLRSWYGQDEEPSLTGRARRDVERLSRLTGAEFEKAYMTMMIEHHSTALKMGIECLNEAYHPEMINKCAEMVGMQGDEIAQLRLWLMQWYGINDPTDHDRGRRHS